MPETVFEGTWRRLVNRAASAEGSIHDDKTAQSLGFEGGFVPGTTVGTAALNAVLSHYGWEWMNGGWYSFTFVTPVYVHEEVCEVAETVDGSSDITVRVVNREGRTCAVGHAGLGTELGPEKAWDPAADGSSGPDVLRLMPIGTTYPLEEIVCTATDIEDLLKTAGIGNSDWYTTASPAGPPVIMPEWVFGPALRIIRRPGVVQLGDEAKPPPMWAHHMLVLERPMLLGRPYTISERLVDKGRSSRTLFVTSEFEVRDADGVRYAIGRHRSKWFALNPAK
jgi:hypothetical protein